MNCDEYFSYDLFSGECFGGWNRDVNKFTSALSQWRYQSFKMIKSMAISIIYQNDYVDLFRLYRGFTAILICSQKQNPTRWVGQWWHDPEIMTAAIYNEIET